MFRRGPTDVDHRQPERTPDGCVGAEPGSERTEPAVHATAPVSSRTVDDDQRCDRVGRRLHLGEVEARVHHRACGGPARRGRGRADIRPSPLPPRAWRRCTIRDSDPSRRVRGRRRSPSRDTSAPRAPASERSPAVRRCSRVRGAVRPRPPRRSPPSSPAVLIRATLRGSGERPRRRPRPSAPRRCRRPDAGAAREGRRASRRIGPRNPPGPRSRRSRGRSRGFLVERSSRRHARCRWCSCLNARRRRRPPATRRPHRRASHR